MSTFEKGLASLQLPLPAAAEDDAFVANVMARCSEVDETRERLPWALFGVAVAAALALVFGVLRGTFAHQDREVVAARGAALGESGATVQAFVARTLPGQPPRLLEGASLRPGDGILLRYSNPGAERRYLMVFALDQERSVHWLHPAYLDAAQNPTSLPLPPHTLQQVLPEVAEPEAPTEGPLAVYALLSRASLDVKSVERRLAQDHRPVAELFEDTEVESWSCTWSTP